MSMWSFLNFHESHLLAISLLLLYLIFENQRRIIGKILGHSELRLSRNTLDGLFELIKYYFRFMHKYRNLPTFQENTGRVEIPTDK